MSKIKKINNLLLMAFVNAYLDTYDTDKILDAIKRLGNMVRLKDYCTILLGE